MSRIRIAAVGDVMCGESFYQFGRGPRTQIDCLGPAFFDEAIGALFRTHDLVLANIEAPLSDAGYRPNVLRRHHMRGRPQVALQLRRWGITLANLANNHILEQGRAAAVDTARHLQRAGIGVIGAGGNASFESGLQPVEAVLGGLRVGVLGACLLDEKYAFSGDAGGAALVAAVRDLAARNDVCVVSLHWGHEYMDSPSSDQRALARTLVGAGATLVLGHHPHVVQGVEQIGPAVVAYSLGNFVFDQLPDDCRWSAILSCELEPKRVVSWRMTPVVLDEHHRPCLPDETRCAQLAAELARRHELPAAAPPDRGRGYVAEAQRRQQTARAQLRQHTVASLTSWPLWYTLQVLARPVLRRAGLW